MSKIKKKETRGRKPTPKADRRTITLKFRVSPNELKAINKKMEGEMSEWIRATIMK